MSHFQHGGHSVTSWRAVHMQHPPGLYENGS